MSLFGGTPASSTPAGGSLFGGASSTAPGTTGTPSLFGTKPPAANLFGGTPAAGTPAASTATSAPSLFGGAQTSSTPAAGGSLFGAPKPATPAAGGNLFGGGAATTASAPAGGSLFGAAPATSQPAGGSSLFGGGAATTSAPATQPAQQTTSLFGGGAASSAAPASSGTTTSTLFGTAQSAPAASSSSLFGAKPAPTLGSSILGGGQQQQQQQTQTQPAVYIDASNLEKFHKFSECNDAMKNLLTMIEGGISDQIRASNDIATKFASHKEAIESVPIDAELMERKLHTTKTFLASDQALLAQIESQVKNDEVSTALSVRTLDLLRSYARPGYSSLPPPTLSTTLLPPPSESDITTNAGMITYFNKEAGNMEQKLQIFVESVKEVEASLRSVEHQAVNVEVLGSDGVKRKEISGGGGRQLNKALRSFNDALNDVGGRLVESKDKLRALERRGR